MDRISEYENPLFMRNNISSNCPFLYSVERTKKLSPKSDFNLDFYS